MKKISLIFCYLFLSSISIAYTQCFPTQPKTAAFATGGTSPNKNQVLWLTWGSTLANVATYPYGKHGENLVNGSSSYASIDLGDGRYLCIEAKISNVSAEGITSYAPGDYGWDSMDDLYNIDGVNQQNKLVTGIKNKAYGGTSTFTITCKATLNGLPVKLHGMVMADAESLAGGESISTTSDGTWNIIELKKNLANQSPYEVRKINTSGTSLQTMEFVKGNDDNTAAIAFCSFNESAFKAGDYEVSFQVKVKGGGHTAIALGVLPPGVDGGDAPASYGNPLHMVEKVGMSNDGIAAGDATGPITNINVVGYQAGSLLSPTHGFLGTTAPDIDVKPLHTKNADGDNLDGTGNINEEDAWPVALRELSYKVYKSSNVLNATIAYKGNQDFYISAWIDFNKNGVFDIAERVVVNAPSNQTSAMLTWNLPPNTKYESTYVRLRYAKNREDILSPTSYTPGGEIEDFRIRIMTPVVTNPVLLNRAKRP